MSLSLINQEISAFAQTEMGRIVATFISVVVAGFVLKIIQRRARNQSKACIETQHGKNSYVMLKNLVLLLTMIVICSIWASKIAGAALSLAAVAGAMLIVSKELLANMLGSAYLTATRSFKVGDFIEIDGIAGRVIDTDLVATTMSEMGEGSQLTSRIVTVPHSLLLIKPLRNLTATGEFVINVLPVSVDPADDIRLHKEALLRAAKEVCDPWLINANLHLKRFESRELIDLPSADPRVNLKVDDPKSWRLLLRYTCEPNAKVNVEQAIIDRYLQYRPAPVPRKRSE